MKKFLIILTVTSIFLLSLAIFFLLKDNNHHTEPYRFEVLSFNKDGKSLDLKIVAPETYAGAIVKARITCPPPDTQIVYTKPSTGLDFDEINNEIEALPEKERLQKLDAILEKAEAQNFVKKETSTESMYSIVKIGDIFSGICGNSECTIINKQCELYKSI